jgi:hypothetical protein
MTVTNKRLLISESHGDSNRCTPYRAKPDQHATYTSHSSSRTPGVHFLRAIPIRDNLSLAQPSSWQPKTDWPSRKTEVTSFLLPCDDPGVGERGFSPMVIQLHQLTGSISPACNRYVQYLLVGVNRTILNRHRQGLQPCRCRLTTYPLPDLPNQLSPLSPNGPARSPVNQVPAIKPKY